MDLRVGDLNQVGARSTRGWRARIEEDLVGLKGWNLYQGGAQMN